MLSKLTFERKILKNIDYSIILSVLFITLSGLISIGAATLAFSEGNWQRIAFQFIWFIISSAVFIGVILIDYNIIGGYYKILYIISIILLIAVLLFGSVRNNAKAWLGVGPLGIQPSEFAKIATIITLAKVLDDIDNINTFKNLSKIALISLIPMALIQLQPDTGTNLIFAMTILGMIFVAGLDLRFIYWSLIAGITSFIAIWKLNILKEYQKNRILVFLRPEMDKLGAGYNAYLAKIAVGSGKFFGVGLFNSGLTDGKFIPEAHTDFIFCVFAEKFGFIGVILLFLAYLNIILKGINIARTSKDRFGMFLVIGILSMFVFQILQNVGMDIGLMPITGIPLPFMSYGGSSLLTNMISIGLIVNVGMRRQKITF
ncbi:rod shape determining protein RodA [Caloramator fervidus]|uniref:Rod shape determining protein RodA n=1 Tax=Caloramator fervidus TaxID=29344 RepID=A0A1H5VQX0_9CLOT|nr:rod shape-determining protein RodA [Caloramator fervidus]SEF89624.1 rod shape determining protein RodA [Caloramator fervidus]